MRSLQTLTNQVCGLPTQTVDALAHRFGSSITCGGHRHSAAVPTKSRVCDPSSLPAHWRDPNSGLASTMHNHERPLGFKIKHVTVGNPFGPERVDHLNQIILENEFGSYPDCVGEDSKSNAKRQLQSALQGLGGDVETVDCEENNQNKRHACENEMTSRPKDCAHISSIAGRI